MKLYLAYGANTNLANMATRCPKAAYVCNVSLHNHRLVFRGVADVTPQRGSKVEVALWIITPECEAALDKFEGFPRLYVKRYVTTHLFGRRHRAMFYVMRSARYEQEPSLSYEHCLRTGYMECGMSVEQIDTAIRRAKAWVVAHPHLARSTGYTGSWNKGASTGSVPATLEEGELSQAEMDDADRFMMEVNSKLASASDKGN